MVTKELSEYIKSELNLGIPQDTIKNALRSSGWEEAVIGEAFSARGISFSGTSRKSLVAGGVLLLLLLVAGSTYFVVKEAKNSPAQITTITPINDPIVAAEYSSSTFSQSATSTITSEKISPEKKQEKASTTINTPTPPILADPIVTIKDCGSVNISNMNSTNGVSQMTAQEKNALTCASAAFDKCSPSTLTYTNTGTTTTSTLKIISKNDLYCFMSMSSNVSKSTPTCKVPMSLISQSSQSALKSASGDLFSYSVVAAGLFFVGMPITNKVTGEVISIECSQ